MCANQRKRTNRISKVEGENGTVYTNAAQVLGMFQDFYKQLFTPSELQGLINVYIICYLRSQRRWISFCAKILWQMKCNACPCGGTFSNDFDKN